MPNPLRRGEIVRIRDERWSVVRHRQHDGVAVVDVCGCERSNRRVRTRFLLPFDEVGRLPARPALRIVSRRRWRHLARQVLGDAVPRYDSLLSLASARIDILPFQLEPALAVVRGLATRVLIADAVGLGKTVQAGLLAAETIARHADARVLVLCPAALRAQWRQELEARFALDAAVFDSASLARYGTDLPPSVNPWAAQQLIVASIDYVKRADVLRALEPVIWDLVIVDEAHGAASATDRHAATAALAARARTVVMLTATPHSGDEAAFARLCGVGDIAGRFPVALFRRGRTDVGMAGGRRTVWLRVRLDPAEAAMHEALLKYVRLVWRGSDSAAARLAMIVLLRRAASSAAALARSIERRLVLLANGGGVRPPEAVSQPGLPFAGDGDDEPGAALAAPGLTDRDDERRHLEAVLVLARAASGRQGKLRVLLSLLGRTAESAIVFTDYRDTLVMLADELGAFGCEVLHGGLLDDERQQALRRFTAGTTRLLLATDAAGEGLNLHARCRLVVNLDVPWTPVRLEQRIGRVDRIGQRQRVHQVLLVAAGTFEQTTVSDYLRRRSAHVARTLDALRPAAGEGEMAEWIVGGPTAAAPASPAAIVPGGVVVPDLRNRAAEEAARARMARALCPGDGNGAGPGQSRVDLALRPFGSSLTRRPVRVCSVHRIVLGDSTDGESTWETLLSVVHGIRLRGLPVRAKEIAAAIEAGGRHRERVIADAQERLLARDRDVVRGAAAAAVARERAIASELQRRSARLAAMLIQRALFDRRLERDMTAQREVLVHALAACRDRVSRLERSAESTDVRSSLVFAALLR